MDEWGKVGPTSKLFLNGQKGRKAHFWGWNRQWLELEREMRETPPSLYDLRRLGSRNLSSQDLKFIHSTRAMLGYRQHAVSQKISGLEKKN